MIAEGQIAFHVLMLIGSAAPVAIYFLTLGLVNCHARPHVVSSRSDFVALSVVLAPLMLWSIPVAIQFGSGWMLGVAVLLLALVFRKLVPRRDEGFVIYNITRSTAFDLLNASIERIAPHLDRIGTGEWASPDGSERIRATGFALLRSVSVQHEGEAAEASNVARRLRGELTRRVEEIEQLPSPIGAGLVLTGVCIAVIPMWLATRHIQDLVEAVVSFFG